MSVFITMQKIRKIMKKYILSLLNCHCPRTASHSKSRTGSLNCYWSCMGALRQQRGAVRSIIMPLCHCLDQRKAHDCWWATDTLGVEYVIRLRADCFRVVDIVNDVSVTLCAISSAFCWTIDSCHTLFVSISIRACRCMMAWRQWYSICLCVSCLAIVMLYGSKWYSSMMLFLWILWIRSRSTRRLSMMR